MSTGGHFCTDRQRRSSASCRPSRIIRQSPAVAWIRRAVELACRL